MDDGSVTSTGGEAMAMLTDDAMVQVAQAKKDAADEAARDGPRRNGGIGSSARTGRLKRRRICGLTGTAGALDEDEIIINRGGSGPARVTSAGYSAADDPALPNGECLDWLAPHPQHRRGQYEPPVRLHGQGAGNPDPVLQLGWQTPTTPSLYADTVTDVLTGGQPADATTVITPSGSWRRWGRDLLGRDHRPDEVPAGAIGRGRQPHARAYANQ